jgi:hypothetical protein
LRQFRKPLSGDSPVRSPNTKRASFIGEFRTKVTAKPSSIAPYTVPCTDRINGVYTVPCTPKRTVGAEPAAGPREPRPPRTTSPRRLSFATLDPPLSIRPSQESEPKVAAA